MITLFLVSNHIFYTSVQFVKSYPGKSVPNLSPLAQSDRNRSIDF